MESVVQSQWLRLDQGQWLGLDQGKVSRKKPGTSVRNLSVPLIKFTACITNWNWKHPNEATKLALF